MPKLIQELPELISTTTSELTEKVKNYFDYISVKVGAGKDVFIADLFTKEILQVLLNQDCDGLRFYLAREDNQDINGNDQQGRVAIMAIPVKLENGAFVDQLTDNNTVCHVECRSTHCQPRTFVNDRNALFN